MSRSRDRAVDVLEIKQEAELGQNLVRLKKMKFSCQLKHLSFSPAGAVLMKEAGTFDLFSGHRPLSTDYQAENLYSWLQRGPNQCT